MLHPSYTDCCSLDLKHSLNVYLLKGLSPILLFLRDDGTFQSRAEWEVFRLFGRMLSKRIVGTSFSCLFSTCFPTMKVSSFVLPGAPCHCHLSLPRALKLVGLPDHGVSFPKLWHKINPFSLQVDWLPWVSVTVLESWYTHPELQRRSSALLGIAPSKS